MKYKKYMISIHDHILSYEESTMTPMTMKEIPCNDRNVIALEFNDLYQKQFFDREFIDYSSNINLAARERNIDIINYINIYYKKALRNNSNRRGASIDNFLSERRLSVFYSKNIKGYIVELHDLSLIIYSISDKAMDFSEYKSLHIFRL